MTHYKIVSKVNPAIVYACGFTQRDRAIAWLQGYKPGNWKAREPVENLEIVEDTKGY